MDIQQQSTSRVGFRELSAVLAMWGLVVIAVLITYSHVSVDQLYSVSASGFAAAAGRVLVYSNFPLAFVAIAVVGFSLARLSQGSESGQSTVGWGVWGWAVVSVALCLIAAFPGVVDQNDLDARAINAVPTIGVIMSMVLFGLAWQRGGIGEKRPWRTVDTVRCVVIGVLAILSLPWILAEVGIYIGDIPGLGSLFLSKVSSIDQKDIAVHLGDHHGFNGALMAISGLTLSRSVSSLRRSWIQMALGWYLALMVVYGLANGAQDFWLEQVVKRGWTDAEMPGMLRPKITAEWGVVLIGIIAVYFLLMRPRAGQGGTSTTQDRSHRDHPSSKGMRLAP